MTKSV